MQILDYYQRLKEDDLSLVYFGNFNDSITEKIIELSESFLDKKNLERLKRKAVFLVAECFQNVARHGIQKIHFHGKLEYINSFVLRIKGSSCYIASANSVMNDKIELLKGRLETINQMDQEELYKLYRQVLEKGKISSKGGASLGLIEMGRRTGNTINYHFEPIGKKYSIFYLMLKFDPEREKTIKEDDKESFSDIRKLYSELLLSRNYLLYKSDFSQDSILPVIQMIESNLAKTSDPYYTKKNLFHGAVEILQNIHHLGYHKHGGIQGIFSYGKESNDFRIESICETEKKNIAPLKSLLDDLKTLSLEELKSRYKETLQSDNDHISDLSFIDLARIAKKWDYKFLNQDDKLPLFNYNIRL